MTDHQHRWAADSFHAGIGCMDCQASGWDWSVARIAELTRDLALANRGLEQAQAIIDGTLTSTESTHRRDSDALDAET